MCHIQIPLVWLPVARVIRLSWTFRQPPVTRLQEIVHL